jgi:ketosteroid isomerase-like protein
MKKTLIYFNLLLCFLAVNFTTQAQSKEEQSVATAVETLKKAIVDADKAALEAITLEELSFGHSSGLIEDKAAFVEALASGKSDFKNMNLSEQTITISDNTALVRHDLKASVENSGTPSDIHLGVLLVWQKQKGQWKLLARQAYKL